MMDKKYWIGIISTLIVLPCLVFGRDRISAVWAAPERVSTIEKKVDKTVDTQDQLAKLVVEQQARLDTNDKVSQANLESLKEQLALIAELKRKR